MESRSDSSGLTLIELAIAMLVFLIGTLGLLHMVVFGVTLNQRSRDLTLATSLAQAKADELLRQSFSDTSLNRGGVIPLQPNSHPTVDNPSPVAGYSDFFNYDGIRLTPGTATVGTPVPTPSTAYFVRQWQIWSCGCSPAGDCSAGCAPLFTNELIKKITVTVTAISPAFHGSYPSSTIVVYKSRIN
jgi:Tfp pilus assembly protein PilV